MNNGDAVFLGIPDIGILANLAIVNDVTGILSRRNRARQNVHQRRFSGAVLTDKSVNLSPLHLEIHIIESFYTGVNLRDVFHFQNNISQSAPPSAAFLRPAESPCQLFFCISLRVAKPWPALRTLRVCSPPLACNGLIQYTSISYKMPHTV